MEILEDTKFVLPCSTIRKIIIMNEGKNCRWGTISAILFNFTKEGKIIRWTGAGEKGGYGYSISQLIDETKKDKLLNISVKLAREPINIPFCCICKKPLTFEIEYSPNTKSICHTSLDMLFHIRMCIDCTDKNNKFIEKITEDFKEYEKSKR